MSKKKKFIFILIAVAFVLLLLLTPLFKVREVVLLERGEKNANFDMKLLEVDDNFFLFDSENFEKELISTGLIESVSIDKDFFCKLRVEITWRRPIISLTSAHSNIILDKDGYVLYISEKKDEKLGTIAGVIVKSARIGKPIVTENDFILVNAVNLYLLIIENENLFATKGMKPNIVVEGDKIIHEINPKYQMNFGDGSEIEEKFSKALAIYNNLCEKGITSGIINVSRKNHYVYETFK